MTGNDLRGAKPTIDENGRPAVSFSLKNEGARKFGKVTGENIGRSLAIVLDNRVRVGAAHRRPDHRRRAHQRRASRRRKWRTSRSRCARARCPATLTYLEERVIGPTLGADSIRSGVKASLVGLLFVVVFMLVYYKLSGVNAVVALLLNLVILLGLMAYLGATMTLPGIAGFVLTMGMGVDSNVLIFERIKEELAAQRGVRAAINARLRPRLPDAARHARRVAHRRRVPVPVRHRPDSRIRDDAVARPAVEPVHVHLRVEDAVRARAARRDTAATGSASSV